MSHYFTSLCPTRSRPKQALRYLESIEKTVADSERCQVLFYIDDDDPTLPAYMKFLEPRRLGKKTSLNSVNYIVGPRKSVSVSWNDLARVAIGDVLVMGNDDVVYVTPQWDTLLSIEVDAYHDDVYCLFFKDLNRKGEDGAVTFPIVSRKWYNTLGYFTPGCYTFGYNDTHLADIAMKIGRMKILPHIQIEHRHWSTTGANDGIVEQDAAKGYIERDLIIYEAQEPNRVADAKKLLQIMFS